MLTLRSVILAEAICAIIYCKLNQRVPWQCSGCRNRTQLSNVLQANAKIIQNHSLATLQTEELHCSLLQAKSKCSLKKEEMTNLAENNRTLPKPSLTDHRVPERLLERVSVDVNTLLSQSN